MLTDADRVPLGGRAWIADGRRGALVAADGTIDWYTPDGIDRFPALARLLDPGGGALRIGPVRDGAGARRRLPPGEQRYVPDTMVAETTLRTGGRGTLRVTDTLPWPGATLAPAGRLVRVATALAGPVDVEVELLPPTTGPSSSRSTSAGAAEPVSAWSEGVAVGELLVRAGVAFEAAPLDRDHPRWRAVRRLEAGESLIVTVDLRRAALDPLSPDAAWRLIDDTVAAWRSWLGPLVVDGPHAAAVRRAAMAVRSLTGPGGGPLAAGTTSLPRRAGGERTADDRSVRLRDAAAASATLARLGLNEDAEAAERWLREALEGSELPWRRDLGPDGGPRPELEELPWAGWRRSQPVVVGAGEAPVDLDQVGDVMVAVSASRRGPWGTGGDGPLAAAAPALAAAADWVADHWTEPDGGVWAVTGRPVRLVASAVQAWLALDASARRARSINPLDLSAAAWHAEARTVLRWLEAEAAADDGGLRRGGGARAGDESDAALLRVAWHGPWPALHPIVVATVERVLERQASGRLLYRLSDGVDDGRPGPDSPDLVASLWAVRALARLGRWEEAHERLEAVVALAGPKGLLAEAADPVSGELLGNLPSTATNLALIDAVLDLVQGPG